MSYHTPMIHLNGTSKNDLVECLDQLYDAVNKAYYLTRPCSPNMRDYYPYSDGQARYEAARERIRGWQVALDAILKDIEADVQAIEESDK